MLHVKECKGIEVVNQVHQQRFRSQLLCQRETEKKSEQVQLVLPPSNPSVRQVSVEEEADVLKGLITVVGKNQVSQLHVISVAFQAFHGIEIGPILIDIHALVLLPRFGRPRS